MKNKLGVMFSVLVVFSMLLSSCRGEFEKIRTSANEANAFEFVENFVEGQKVRIEHQKHVIREKMTVFEEKQEGYREAAISLKTIEKLEDKERSDFKMRAKKLEQKKMDEMATLRHGRDFEI